MESAQADGAKGREAMNDQEKEARREAEQLRLSRAYLQQQMQSSTHERYTQSLRKALSDVEEKLRRLEEKS